MRQRTFPLIAAPIVCLTAVACFAAADDEVSASESGANFTLSLPVDCQPGASCFVQSYVDRDSGPGAKDYRCGAQTYDGHKGTDFRVAHLNSAGRTPVVAAAAGVVTATRDSVEDQRIDAIDRGAIEGVECGNGVVIDHGGGWETQYCHMASGSIAVQPGQKLSPGDRVGTVGLSGDTEFPHLHLSVRHDGQVVDPFGAEDAADCGSTAETLWNSDAQEQLAYRRSEVINSGFATAPVTMNAIELASIGKPSRTSPALVAYVRAINLKEGDILSLRLKGPDGETVSDSASDPLDRDKAQWMVFAGRKIRGDSWPGGRYTASFSVSNAGKVVIERQFSIDL